MKIFEQNAESIDITSKRVSDVAGNTEEQVASVHELGNQAKDSSHEAITTSAATEEVSSSIDQVTRAISDASSSIKRISNEMSKFTTS